MNLSTQYHRSSTGDTMTDTCHRCGRPVADSAPCCTACVEQTRTNLDYVAANAGELETTLTRQDRVSSGTGGRASAETPLPINLHASDVGHRLRNTLSTWTRLVAEERGTTLDEAFPSCSGDDGSWCTHKRCRDSRLVSNKDMASWLKDRLGWIAHREWGPECFDQLSRCAVELQRAIDSPPPMIALGKCDRENCGGELRAHPEAAFVKCPKCRDPYDVAKRKAVLLDRANHIQRGAASLARILTALGDRDPEGRPIVRNEKWITNRVQRKQLLPVGKDPSGRPLYSLGAARRLHDQDIQQAILKAAKQAQKEVQAA
jgi:hypothetical protein